MTSSRLGSLAFSGLIAAGWLLYSCGGDDDSGPRPDAVAQVDAASNVDAPLSTIDAASPDSALTCEPACGSATVQYPNGASATSQPTYCANGACGTVTLDNRSGFPADFTRATCDSICAASTHGGVPMQCSAKCSQAGAAPNFVYSYGGGTAGGFSTYGGFGQDPVVLPQGCSEVPSAVIGSTDLKPWQHEECCCEATN